MKHFKRLLAILMSVSMTAGAAVQSVGATAGEKPPEIFEDEIVFPDPDSFSYDDVEVNFAKALQYVLYFYDANKCGRDTDPDTGEKLKQLEWRGDCHLEDYNIPLKPVSEEGADAKFGTNLSQEFIDKYRDILDPEGDGYIDCGGGMHDAGDHVKFGLPGSYAASTLGWGYYEFRDAYVDTGTQEHIEDILHWFNDFYMKGTYLDEDGKVIAFCYQVGEGNNDHNYWCPPELQDSKSLLNFARPAYFATTESPASDMCAGTSASLAINYLNFKDTEPEYAEESLKKAIALYDFAVETHKEADDSNKVLSLGYDGGFYNSSYDYDELAWAAVWLNICTGEQHYIDDIVSVDTSEMTETGGYKYTGYIKRIIETTGSTWQNIWVHCWDTVWGGVFAKLAPITNNERDWFIFRWNLEFWSGEPHLKTAGLADEIWNMDYQHIKEIDESDKTYLKKTPAGFSMLNEYGSARYNTAAGLCAMVYRKETAKFDEEYEGFTDWAENQMEYIMGKNPMNRPYIVGYSPTAASHPHHRAAHGSSTFSMDDPIDQSHTLWGALVGGPDAKDWHRDITKDYVYNEVAVDYNAGIVGDLAGLYHYYGTDKMQPEENFPPKEEEGDRYWIEGLINQENIERTQFSVKVHYESKLPPKYLTQSLKARYYFDISELIPKGQSIKDVKVEVYYDEVQSTTDMKQSAKVSQPIHYKDNIYYVEMDWTNTLWRGSRVLQVGIIVGQDENYESNWDPTNDYSRNALVLSDDFGETQDIPLYFEDELVYGHPPVEEGESSVTTTTTAKTTTTAPNEEYIYGDIDLNGVVEMTDLTALSQYLMGDIKIEGKALKQADTNGDGNVDIADLSTLKQYILKEPVTLGPQKK
ncbi:MAG: glycoside hydrolase family 9 protein [Oscillospiraceae bacterium]|nr:glycoside hydrolase family 9 protein [Oscillospiraceae bacterium]